MMRQVWWTYQAGDSFSEIYHWFNQFEAAIWFVLAALVAARFARFRRSPLELVYAASFFAFGVSDLIEARYVPTWLILAKGLNLAAIIGLRRYLLKHYYPFARTF